MQSLRIWIQFGEFVSNANEEALPISLLYKGDCDQEVLLGWEFALYIYGTVFGIELEEIYFGEPQGWFEDLNNMN